MKQVLIPIFIFFLVQYSFAQDLKVYEENNKKGYKTSNEKIVIPSQFDDAREFNENYAAIKLNNYWTFINENGEAILPLIFDSISNIKKNSASVIYKGYKTGIKITDNNTHLPFSYPIFFVTQKPPQFPGGEEALRNFIKEKIKYPKKAKSEGIGGKVFITFEIKSDGKIGHTTISKSIEKTLDEEAIRIIKLLPTWTPAKIHSEPVSSWYTIPINFIP